MDMKVKYVGDENLISRYTVITEGRRIFDVLVDNATAIEPAEYPEGMPPPPAGHSLHRIAIAMVDAPVTTRQATNGFAVRGPIGDLETGMGYQINPLTVKSYLHGREATLLARLFVPAAS
jgi:hypothetical protein